ncbi:carboxypeptidase-like regulatory domain-containing protein [Marininema halotolerans]|uniref:Carboxypeptidase regulatory-like domain-containing protein n=1 Tax=Marininema halotolerans TaxID=1155944 RepID=A0A1I6P5M5_9BACL|nr:carboxypeptidase-like regulatory domain-containing protein [Marininema halotolerans]SFS35479.1 Carboxypeptidase regulatory-like domain-containing protein [Marininema halotolerans]
MYRTRWIFISLILFLVAIVTGCSFSHNQPKAKETIMLKGTVTDEKGNPIAQASVVPESKANPPVEVPEKTVYTDEDGTFVWHLKPGPYDLSVFKDGYKRATQRINLSTKQKTASTTIVLQKSHH